MFVRDVMHSPVLTVEAHTPLADAYRTMQQHRIRHLPIVRSGALVGVVTDRDLRYATSSLHPSPFSPDARVADVMSHPPVTATPLDPVEEAARVMRDRKIGCLPVVDGGRIEGIVAGTDLLDALIRLTGVGRPGGRISVRLDDRPGAFARLTAAVAETGVNIHAVLTYPDDDEVRTILRVDTLDTHRLAHTLRERSFDVQWPPEKPWSP